MLIPPLLKLITHCVEHNSVYKFSWESLEHETWIQIDWLVCRLRTIMMRTTTPTSDCLAAVLWHLHNIDGNPRGTKHVRVESFEPKFCQNVE